MRTRIIKTIVLLAAASGTLNAYAVSPGLYMGLMFGPATNNGKEERAQLLATPTLTTPVNPKSQQFGSRIFLGYKASQYFGVEGGLTYFSTIKYVPKGDVQTCGVTNSRVQDFDFVGKGTIPLGKSFDVFAKAGAAMVYQTTSGALSPNLNQSCGESTNETHVRPTFGIGASYDLSQSWVTDLSVTNVQVGGKVGSMTMFAIGLSYHIVDVYCGQFLCA
jgi:OOP family OmpA-OmpF porin